MTESDMTKVLATSNSLSPQVWGMLKEVGTVFCQSRKMSILTPQEGAVKVLFCLENQLPLTAARGLYFVNGKLGVESGVIAALIRQHPRYDYTVKELDKTGCTIAITLDGNEIGQASFDESDAGRAGLLKKHNYQHYPRSMYFSKAIERAQRWYAPDIFMAPTYAAETMGDWAIEGQVTGQRPPKREKPPEFEQLIEKFGVYACTQAGVFTAANEGDLWAAVDKLSIIAASDESEQLDKERAAEVVPTIEEVAQDIDNPFSGEAA